LAVTFTGSSYLSTTSVPGGLNMNSANFTAALWVNCSTLTPGASIVSNTTNSQSAFLNIVGSTMGGTGGTRFTDSLGIQGYTDGRLYCDNAVNFWTQYLEVDAGVLTLNSWQHIACVFNGSAFTVYVNGSSVGLTVYGSVPTTAIAWARAVVGGFAGQASDAFIFNRALSSTEIGQLRTGRWREVSSTGLVGYWPLYSGANTTDASGNGRTLTATGTVTNVTGTTGGTLTVASTLSATLSVSGGSTAISGSTTSASTLAGSLRTTKPIAGSSAIASTLAAALSLGSGLAGTSSIASTLAGNLSTAKPIAASTTSASTLTAALSVSKPISASTTSASTLSATITQAQAFAGSTTVASTLTGSLSVAGAVAYWKVAAPAAHSGPNNLTLAARFNANGWGGSTWWFGSGTIVAIDAAADVNDRLHIETYPGTPGVLYALASANAESAISQEEAGGLTTGTWHHVALTISGAGVVAIYVDGSIVTGGSTETGGLAAWASQAWGDIWIGDFDGILHDVVIYDAALSAGEITTLSAFRNPTRAANLVGYWPLDTSAPTADLSGNGRTLTATGTPATTNAAGGTPWAVFGATTVASTLSATLTTGTGLSGSGSVASTLAGSLTVSAALTGSTSSASTLAAALLVAKPVSGSSTVASTLSATLGTGTQLAGASSVASTLTAALVQAQALAGSGAVSSTLAATLGVSVALTGTQTAGSTLSATLGVSGVFAGTSTVASTLTATLLVGKPLTGSLSGASTLAAALSVSKPIAGTHTVSSTLAASLNTGKPLTGSSAVASTLSGTLQQARALAGGTQVASTLAATLRQLQALVGTAASSSTLTATISGGTAPILPVVSGWDDGGDIPDEAAATGTWVPAYEVEMAPHGKWYEDPVTGGIDTTWIAGRARSGSSLAGTMSRSAIEPSLVATLGGAGSYQLQKNWIFGTGGNIGSAAALNAEFTYHDPFNTITNGTNYGAMIVRAPGAPTFGVYNYADIGLANDQQPEDPGTRYREFTVDSMLAHVKPLNTGSTVVGPASAHNAGCGSLVSKLTYPAGGTRLGQTIVWETRCRMVTAPNGYWFALWIVGPSWDGGPEIDVIEGFSSTSPNVNGDLWNANGIGGSNSQNYFGGPWDNVISTLGLPGYALPNGAQSLRNWHTFTMEYKADNSFRMYMDSTLIQSGSLDWKVPTSSTVPPLSFLFDFGFGHTAISPINSAVIADINATPLTYEIAYSRIWLR
jgi:hypothetical protein